ncbi:MULTISPECIES: MFS transporter [unclassified Roseitalea]|uniref:MFS transporter n=1 Tax=unclassified Roseitalea TaxID=2639107 RepID=UPI00273D7583|nr:MULTISPECIES: MFS transporter [unclassified Roseitalea]
MSDDTGHAGVADGRFEAFAYPAYVKYWAARFASNFAGNVVVVAVGWQIYDLTRDPLDLGIAGLVQFVPLVLFMLVTGSVADRFGRRTVMAWSVAVEIACTLVILALTWRGLTSPLPVFAALFVFGIARAFFGPASQSLVVNLVPGRVFPNAVAWNSSAWQVASIVGPVAGGLLYGVGATVAYGAAAVVFVVALLLVIAVPKPAQRADVAAVTFSSLFAGLRYIRDQKVILGAISLDLFAVFLGSAVALLPVFARDVLEAGPWALGMLRAAPGVGALLMAVFLATSPIRDHAGRILLVSVGLFGLFTVVFGVSTVAWLSVIALALIGAFDMISVYLRETLLQLWTPDWVRGRVNAVNMVFLGASNELGDFRAGVVAAGIGAMPAVVIGGISAMAIAAGWAFLFPQLRDVRRLHRPI